MILELSGSHEATFLYQSHDVILDPRCVWNKVVVVEYHCSNRVSLWSWVHIVVINSCCETKLQTLLHVFLVVLDFLKCSIVVFFSLDLVF